jgi:uncharacterized protein YmfQ (DUF2313 family)
LSTSEKLAMLLAIDPPGAALPAEVDSTWGAFLTPLADALDAADARMQAMLPQVDPRNAVDLLPDFERVLGPDPAGRDAGVLSLGARQALAFQRWTGAGGCSPGFYQALATASGVPMTIEEFASAPLGLWELGESELAPEADDLTWRATLPTELLIDFELGGSELGDALGDFAPNPFAAVLKLYQQPHTLLLISYTTGP